MKQNLRKISLAAVLVLVFLDIAAGHQIFPSDGERQATNSVTSMISGVVRDAITEEPLSRARIVILSPRVETASDGHGQFQISIPFTAQVDLQVGTVGYAMLRMHLDLSPQGETEVVLRLNPEASLGRSDKVTVTTSPFEPVESGSILEKTLNYSELKNMASVLVDDPLRSVQGLPGVATGDDFNAQFSVRGEAFRHVGLYMDGQVGPLLDEFGRVRRHTGAGEKYGQPEREPWHTMQVFRQDGRRLTGMARDVRGLGLGF